jgi:phosphomannomutase
MTLIKSISGIRGTIGGHQHENLTPLDVVLFTSAYAEWVKQKFIQNENNKVVVGRDARLSGEMIQSLVISTLTACGINVVDIGLSTTPTTEIAVTEEKAQGGIIITASHNPEDWNALKLLNCNGEFISEAEGKTILNISQNSKFFYSPINKIGTIITKNYLSVHIKKILDLPLIKKDIIAKKKLKIVVDGINSVGAIAVPELLKSLGINDILVINGEANGRFNHNPEPLDEHLTEIKQKVVEEKAHLGIVVDPDVDRLAFICEDGSMFGEEYTLVSVADYVLQNNKGRSVVTNLSSTRALDDIAKKYGSNCYRSAVGEVNVVEKMKQTNAIVGGEGNGGIIFPELHYGRDALVGIALFLSYYVQLNFTMSQLRKKYPDYYMIKHKIKLNGIDEFFQIKEKLKKNIKYKSVNEIDGIWFELENSWIHCRPSNTEPIIRIYIEAPTKQESYNLLKTFEQIII